MERRETQSIGGALDAFFENNPTLALKLAENRLINAWKTILGAAVMRYTDELYIKRQCLYVKILSSVVKAELMMCRETLIQKLNAAAGKNIIDNIKFL